MGSPSVVQATGTSMAPFILPNSRLTVERVQPDTLQIGDVVCYIDGQATGVAHRLVRIAVGPGGKRYFTRGDAQFTEEEVPPESLVYRVLRVEHKYLSYQTCNPIGKILAKIALSQSPNGKAVKRLLANCWSLAVFLKRRNAL